MGDLFRAAVIPTRDRHDMVADCIGSVVDQVDRVIVIDNQSDPPIDPEPWHGKVSVVAVPLDPPNISTLWNVGLALADAQAHQHQADRWDIAVLNSDVTVPPGWIDGLSTAMRSTTAVLAYPDQHGGKQAILHTKAEPIDLRQRITGYAFMMRGEIGQRFDEDLAWWYGDDAADWTARENGGALLVPGLAVEHRCPNGSIYERPELRAQTARDRETFHRKWGRTPW
jgi:GT2 family glycosyltransferase